MNLIFQWIVKMCKISASEAANSPSRKNLFQEKLPKAVKKLKKYQ